MQVANVSQVFAEATVVFPLIVAATFAKANQQSVEWLE